MLGSEKERGESSPEGLEELKLRAFELCLNKFENQIFGDGFNEDRGVIAFVDLSIPDGRDVTNRMEPGGKCISITITYNPGEKVKTDAYEIEKPLSEEESVITLPGGGKLEAQSFINEDLRTRFEFLRKLMLLKSKALSLVEKEAENYSGRGPHGFTIFVNYDGQESKYQKSGEKCVCASAEGDGRGSVSKRRIGISE